MLLFYHQRMESYLKNNESNYYKVFMISRLQNRIKRHFLSVQKGQTKYIFYFRDTNIESLLTLQ